MRRLHDHEINECNKAIVVSTPHSEEDTQRDVYTTSLDDIDAHSVFHFQSGPVEEKGVNGITNEVLLAILIDRLRGFQLGEYRCRENALALTKLEEAMHWLHSRTREREKRGVEGTHTP